MELLPTEDSSKPSADYRSRFTKWDDKSWVRSKPHRMQPFEEDLCFYSKDVCPLFSHWAVQEASDTVQKDLLVLQLYTYLEFTVWLELGPVNEVCDLIRRENFLPWLPSQMKGDALKIYVDEGGHAEMSHALITATVQHTSVSQIKPAPEPKFISAIDAIIAKDEPEFAPMIKLFFVIISETLITGTLTQLPKDTSIQRAVRDLAEDHATDEGRHHAYFRQVFEFVWPRLPRVLRRKIALMLPEMLLAFLEPDQNALLKMLQRYPMAFPEPERILSEIMSHPQTWDGINKAAEPSIKMLASNRVFEDPIVKLAFSSRRFSFLGVF